MQIRESLGPLRRRAWILLVVTLGGLAVLTLRLLELQIIDGAEWQRLAENNRLRRLPVAAFRGRIYDRRGVVLADNLPAWELLVFPDDARDLDRTGLFLARIGIGSAASLAELLRQRPQGPLAPMVVGEDLSWQQVAAVRARQSEFPELSVVSGFRRSYPNGYRTAHVVGYLRPVNRRELELRPELDPNALVGASGSEKLYEDVLSGVPGEQWIVVSAVGQQLGVVRRRASLPGRDLTLTLDATLQQAAVDALGDWAGAVVALDPRSGAVRAMYSSPSFDPNIFAGRLSQRAWEELRDDPAHPLQNRALQGLYPPGSTIKPFFALGALTDELVTPEWSTYCRGSIVLYDHPFRCWRRGGHGRVSLLRSLEVSCDIYYYLLGQHLQIEGMERWLRTFGFGEPTGIGLDGEAAGLIGTPEWSQRVRGHPWYPGESVSVAIGQGPLLVTTMQLARGYAALANGGRLVRPRLVEETRGSEPIPLPVDADDLRLVVEGLRRVVAGSEGTARSLARLPAAGKTGTAQVARLQEGVKVEELAESLRHHALFVGWVPVDRPELVVAVLVEHGGGGGSVAAPIAGSILAASLEE